MSRRAFERWNWACYVAQEHLTTAQRVVLLIVARHAAETESGSRAAQATIAAAADLDERSVRRALVRLEELGLIIGEHRPGKTTIWTLNPDATLDSGDGGRRRSTPDTSDGGEATRPRTPATGVKASPAHTDPGRTPDAPRTPASYEGEGEGLTASSPPTVPRDVGEKDSKTDTPVTFDPTNLVQFRRIAS